MARALQLWPFYGVLRSNGATLVATPSDVTVIAFIVASTSMMTWQRPNSVHTSRTLFGRFSDKNLRQGGPLLLQPSAEQRRDRGRGAVRHDGNGSVLVRPINRRADAAESGDGRRRGMAEEIVAAHGD